MKLIIKTLNNTRPYINKDGEIVLDLRPKLTEIGSQKHYSEPFEFRILDENPKSHKFFISDRGFFKATKNSLLTIKRKENQ